MPPPKLAGHADRLDNRANARQIGRPAFAGAVQIDQMEAFRPQIDPMPGHGGRIVAENGLLAVIALPKAYALPPSQVDRRPDFHAIAAPARRRAQRQNTQYDTQTDNVQAGGNVPEFRAAQGGSPPARLFSRRACTPRLSCKSATSTRRTSSPAKLGEKCGFGLP